ncbi:MAG: diacylglycerol kinase family protein, partial [Rhodospirillaceae bacterium]
WLEPFLAGETNTAHFVLVDVEEIPGVLAQCAQMGAETIVVNGGDGTADVVFGGLLNLNLFSRLPAVALLPAGKTNMTTAGWSLTGEVEEALRAVLDARRRDALKQFIMERPVLGLDRGDGQPPLYGAFFGAAEVVDGIRFCRRHVYPLRLPNALSHSAAI